MKLAGDVVGGACPSPGSGTLKHPSGSGVFTKTCARACKGMRGGSRLFFFPGGRVKSLHAVLKDVPFRCWAARTAQHPSFNTKQKRQNHVR